MDTIKGIIGYIIATPIIILGVISLFIVLIGFLVGFPFYYLIAQNNEDMV